MTQVKSKQEIEDFVRGCTFMGTGGGGNPEDGVKWLSELLEKGKTIEWVSAHQIQDEAWTLCPYLMGSIAPKTEETKRKMAQFGLIKKKVDNMAAEAARQLSDYLGVSIEAVVPIELGGAATSAAVVTAALLGVPMVDGDYAGRAIPEVPQTTPGLSGAPMWPMASVDSYGNVTIIKDSVSYEMAERIAKYVSAASFELCGNAAFLLKGEAMKRIVLKNTVTKCFHIGKAIREARKKGGDPVEAAREVTKGWILFKGEVTGKDWEDKEGYYWGTHTITGVDKFKGNEFKIWFKNENHITWINGGPFVTSPDIIVVMDQKTGEPKINPSIEKGDKVAVMGIEAAKEFTTEKGIEILGPKHFGFGIDYKPIAQQMG